MKSSTLAAIGGTTFGLAGAALAARAMRRGLGPTDRLIHQRADQLNFEELFPGVSRAVLRGDPEHGAYAAFTRFSPGARVPLHTHPNDVMLVVISGAYIYGTDAGEQRVEPGSYFVIPAGLQHWSAGDAREGALFFQDGELPFGLDLIH